MKQRLIRLAATGFFGYKHRFQPRFRGSTMSNKPYADVTPNPNFSEIEERNLIKWKEEGTFEKSIKGSEDYIFYDGPPFANG